MVTETLEARVQRLEDIRSLEDLIARYAYTADLGYAEKYADLFVEDGAIDLRDMNLPRFQGRDQLIGFVKGPEANAGRFVAQHFAAPTTFFIDGDEAVGEGFSFTLHRDPDDGKNVRGEGEAPLHPIGVHIVHANFSRWTFRRVGGEWKIVERVVKLLASPDAEVVFASTFG